MLNVAVLTVHSCPLATLGEQDAGGMNVYVLALAHSIIGKDLSIDIYTREHESYRTIECLFRLVQAIKAQ